MFLCEFKITQNYKV
uniref:Uncharacterized protein n=1 Tax=Rhizophora mucronata TaxID=61149 RepID=A0A2P2R2K4_RHIMU